MTALQVPLLVLLAVVTLVALLVTFLPGGRAPGCPNAGTRFFLVLLRLSIGWHFLFEAAEKFTTAGWSGEAYLRESSGPLAPYFRELAGDSVAERLTVEQDADGKPALPEQLALDWDAYFRGFVNHYGLTEEQTTQAQAKFDQARANMLSWLTTATQTVKVPSAMPPALEVEMTMPQRLEKYQELLARVEKLEQEGAEANAPEVQAKLKSAKAEAGQMRSALKKDLDVQTAAMQESLRSVLTPAQKDQERPAPEARSPRDYTPLQWSDELVKWGLLVVGVCLLLGLLTRAACVAGALFLLSFFLAMPPLPGLPTPPRAEGHYLYINKNVIEMLALLTLATTASGRWFGLDALLQFLLPWRWRRPAVTPPVVYPEVPAVTHVSREAVPDSAHLSASPVSKEMPHGS